MGTRGMGRLYQRGNPGVWWYEIGVGGRKLRMSTGIRGGKPGKPPREAELFRAAKLIEIGRTGTALTSATFEEVTAGLITRYVAENRPALTQAKRAVSYLSKSFAGFKVREMTTDRLLAYCVKRRDVDKAAVATVNQEMGMWHRALVLALESGRIESFKRVPRLPGANVRQGSIDAAPLAAILAALPVPHAQVVRFLRLTGWRCNEALNLERNRVDWTNLEIRLDTSKTGAPRLLPFAGYRELETLLWEQEQMAVSMQTNGRILPWVFFHEDGRPINYGSLQWEWNKARLKAGHPKAIIHDLRRTLVRAMERAGVSRSAGMRITGHKSESCYRRYAVVERQDVTEAIKKLSQASVTDSIPRRFGAGQNKP